MATRMQQRRGTAAQWISTNTGNGPILSAGEIGFESDTNKFKIGDGINHWVDLTYFTDADSILAAVSGIVDGAPDLLNTLNELAAALGDDPNYLSSFATTSYVDDAIAEIPSPTISIQQVATDGTATETYSNITTLQFDEDSGFDVTSPTTGTAKVAMNSTFKYWEVDGTQQLTAVGLDTVNFISGTGIDISADGNATPQELTISADFSGIVTGDIVGTTDYQSLSNKTLMGTTTLGDGPDNYGEISSSSNNVEVKAYADLTLTAQSNDIILSAGNAVYIASAASGNEVATQSYVDSSVQNVDISSKQDVVTGVSDIEIGYLDGVTSAIQDQLDAKLESSDIAGLATETYVDTAISEINSLPPQGTLAPDLDGNFDTIFGVTNAYMQHDTMMSPNYLSVTFSSGSYPNLAVTIDDLMSTNTEFSLQSSDFMSPLEETFFVKTGNTEKLSNTSFRIPIQFVSGYSDYFGVSGSSTTIKSNYFTSEAGKFLTTDGTNPSWAAISFAGLATETYVDDALVAVALPSQTLPTTTTDLAILLGSNIMSFSYSSMDPSKITVSPSLSFTTEAVDNFNALIPSGANFTIDNLPGSMTTVNPTVFTKTGTASIVGGYALEIPVTYVSGDQSITEYQLSIEYTEPINGTRVLSSNGASASWTNIDSLPTQAVPFINDTVDQVFEGSSSAQVSYDPMMQGDYITVNSYATSLTLQKFNTTVITGSNFALNSNDFMYDVNTVFTKTGDAINYMNSSIRIPVTLVSGSSYINAPTTSLVMTFGESNAGKFLTTDGASASWVTVEQLPVQDLNPIDETFASFFVLTGGGSSANISYDPMTGPADKIRFYVTDYDLSQYNTLIPTDSNFTVQNSDNVTPIQAVFTKTGDASYEGGMYVELPVQFVSGSEYFNVGATEFNILFGESNAGKVLKTNGTSTYWGTVDTTGLATETYVDTAVTGLATEAYVDTAVGNVTVDLSTAAGTNLDWNASTEAFDVNSAGLLSNPTISTGLTLDGTGDFTISADANIILDATTEVYVGSAATGNEVATKSYADAAAAAIVDSAPETLNTLNELAAALNDDASYAATITTALGEKAPLNSPTFTGTVDLSGATVTGLPSSGADVNMVIMGAY